MLLDLGRDLQLPRAPLGEAVSILSFWVVYLTRSHITQRNKRQLSYSQPLCKSILGEGVPLSRGWCQKGEEAEKPP